MGRGLVWDKIPEIHKKGTEVLSGVYADQQAGLNAIAGLEAFYQQSYADFYGKNKAMIQSAILAIQDSYRNTVFPEQKFNAAAHPDNMQHKDFAGCFRCHDGKHISPNGKETVRLECNLCHSVPTVSTAAQLVSNIPVSKGYEPENHKNPNWINLHRTTFDKSCATCHTVEEPGGVSNKSFCSNSICHGATWKFAGFDAPKVRELLKSQQPTPAPTTAATASPKATAAPTVAGATAAPTQAPSSGNVTFADVSPLFEKKCNACHGETGIKGLSLTSYAKVMAGATSGPVVVPGKPDESVLVKVQAGGSHPGQFTDEELALIKKWISAGAKEK
jgi:mono/diheme cytochrome c family protein